MNELFIPTARINHYETAVEINSGDGNRMLMIQKLLVDQW